MAKFRIEIELYLCVRRGLGAGGTQIRVIARVCVQFNLDKVAMCASHRVIPSSDGFHPCQKCIEHTLVTVFTKLVSCFTAVGVWL